jgi:enoyl-CoA hydratase/carnithine racemase
VTDRIDPEGGPVEFGYVLLSLDGAVALVELNDPDHRNALEVTTVEADLSAALEWCRLSEDVRVVVLTGRGPSFCAGAYLGTPRPARSPLDQERTSPERLAYGWSFGDFWHTLHDFPKPIVAAVRGFAIGGGWKLAFLCDLIVAGESAVLGSAEMKLGLTPSPTTSRYLVEMLGKHRALELFLTSSRLTADECLALGLVNRVVSDDQCLDEALGIASEIAALPPVAVALTKRLISRAAALDDDYELDRAYATYLRTAEASGGALEQAKRDHQRGRGADRGSD